MRKQSKVYKSSLPKEVIIQPAAEVEALERRLRLAASAYYESPAQKQEKRHGCSISLLVSFGAFRNSRGYCCQLESTKRVPRLEESSSLPAVPCTTSHSCGVVVWITLHGILVA